jgi:hypothetical protein
MLTATGEAVQTSAGDLQVVTVDGRKGRIFWRIASGAVFAVVDGEKSKLRNFSRYSSFYTSSITVNWQKTWSEVCRELRNYLETSWGS